MKLVIISLFFFIISGNFCLAQSTVSKNNNAVASSQIRVSIPSYAVINLANNRSKSVTYSSSSELQHLVKLNTETKVEANNKWSVNVIRERNDIKQSANKEALLSKTVSPTYTVIYVATQI